MEFPPEAYYAMVQKPLSSYRMQTRKQKPDIYRFSRRFRSAYSCLEKSTLDRREKELIRGFIEHLEPRNAGIAKLPKYIFILKIVARNLGVQFEKATRKDIEHFMAWL